MTDIILPLIGATTVFACIGLGGGFYEHLVVDPAWPNRPDIIQPSRGGISRKRFWIGAHMLLELSMILSLVLHWSVDSASSVRWWLWMALLSHSITRIWSLVDFIPKALAFERATNIPFKLSEAKAWTQRSLGRVPFAIASSLCTLMAFHSAVVAITTAHKST